MPAAIEALVSIMNNTKASDAARVSAACALLDRGYGKGPQHIDAESGSYVVRLPEVAKSAEEWEAPVRAERGLPSEQASSKPEARIGLLLEAKKPAAE